jgi:hypothetical protein
MALAIASVVGGSALVAPPAAAAPESTTDIADPAEVVGDLVPGLLAQTVENPGITVGDEETPTVEIDGIPEAGALSVEFSVDYALDVLPGQDGITPLSTDSPSVVAHVQPTGAGVRVMTAIADSSAPESYDYTFDVPEGTTLTDRGDFYYLEHDDDLYGSLQKPWAIDAEGKSIQTHYTWDGQTLTQHVDLSTPGIAYPVLADPGWNYSYKFPISKTTAQVQNLLTTCFNCEFPVSGAPRAFPKTNQLLPLKVVGVNFECTFQGNRYDSYGKWLGFRFNATKNHIDGAGSHIIFEFRPSGGKNHLFVSAYVANDSFWVNNAFYRSGAIQTWQKFANNIG